MTISNFSKLMRNTNIVSSEIDGETVMMDASFSHYFGMTEIGTRIWQLLENQISFNELCVVLTNEFEVTKEQCAKDILPFLISLEQNEMIFIS